MYKLLMLLQQLQLFLFALCTLHIKTKSFVEDEGEGGAKDWGGGRGKREEKSRGAVVIQLSNYHDME